MCRLAVDRPVLLTGSDDGVYAVTGALDAGPFEVQRVLRSDRVFRIRTFDGLPGVFAATASGLYHSRDAAEWTDLDAPRTPVYAVVAPPDGDRLFVGTRPARLYVAPVDSAGALGTALEWRELDSFHALSERDGWGIPRHEDVAQVRSLHAPADAPARLVAGVEVGGVYRSADGGATWTRRGIDGFDAPHTDDVHHLAVVDSDTVAAATGSGLYRTTDAGRTWARLDDGQPQTYFRESLVHDGTLFAGGSTTPPSRWETDADHALFESRDGAPLQRVGSPTPDEVAVGWCQRDDDVVAVTHRGTLLRRRSGEWRASGSVPAPESVHGRCLPLESYDP